MDQQEIFTMIRANLVEVLGDVDAAAVTMDRSLAELGCNSVDRAEVVTMTMADMGIRVPVMEFQDAASIGSLVGLFARHA
jgi:polyketide biosynthesis acyl carrier protein